MSLSPVGSLKSTPDQSVRKVEQPKTTPSSNALQSEPVVRNAPADSAPVTYNKSGVVDPRSQPPQQEASTSAKEIIGNFPK